MDGIEHSRKKYGLSTFFLLAYFRFHCLFLLYCFYIFSFVFPFSLYCFIILFLSFYINPWFFFSLLFAVGLCLYFCCCYFPVLQQNQIKHKQCMQQATTTYFPTTTFVLSIIPYALHQSKGKPLWIVDQQIAEHSLFVFAASSIIYRFGHINTACWLQFALIFISIGVRCEQTFQGASLILQLTSNNWLKDEAVNFKKIINGVY